jgi:DNA-directed RNA polymerase specialized sigma24 family protein
VDAGWFERLEALMARMAAGDESALYQLYQDFGDCIGRMLRSEFRRLGVERVDPAEIDGLTLDACIDLFARAGSWDPTRGVTPWTWAQFRLRALVVAHVGQFADALPEEGPAQAAAPPLTEGAGADADPVSTLRSLAGSRPVLRLLQEGLDRVSPPAQQAILLEVKVQAALGDPSPAVTVGQMTGVRPDTIRQTVKRVLDRLRHLATADPRFAPLADLPLLGLAA